ncbi:ABC transporter permease subunit (plasmid) [Pseudohalocynthiibacter aestuariivivens]|nr:ABC transporter permease subunit [Pseudohalocynthiibacter aestuariivivens]
MTAALFRKPLLLPTATVVVFFALAIVGAVAEDIVLPPSALEMPITEPLNAAMAWFVDTFGFIFKSIAWLLEWPVYWTQSVLQWLPWSVTTYAVCVLALRASGVLLTMFCALTCVYIASFGYWVPTMNSLALVLVSVPMSIALGFAIGAWGFYSDRAHRVVIPTLDLLQTIPAFAYLIPILLLFGFGTTVGLISSIIFAFPPMVRNTIVGLQNVPGSIVESGQMSGANERQLFWQVRTPAALRQILLGVNQCTMAALSMVIIASIIGGTNDIGWEVTRTMRKAQFGDSLLAGIVIALIAMIMDRITWGLAIKAGTSQVEKRPQAKRRAFWAALAGLVMIVGFSLIFPALSTWPKESVVGAAGAINQAVTEFVASYGHVLKAIKNNFFFFVMLPIKSGMLDTVSPFSWGFKLMPWHMAVYTGLIALIAYVSARRISPYVTLLVMVSGVVYFFGLTNIPWLAFVIMFVLLAHQLGGRRLIIGVVAGLVFLIVTGSWEKAVLSLYIVSLAVMICFLLGTTIGVLAAEHDRFSAMVRPVSDTLQTMPLFVILIPFVMLFKIGEFTALLSICAYAIVPAIRYAEHGLRNLPHQVVEAAESFGTTPLQMLFRVKLPMALPVILLGLNQTIMYAIAMLVIAALVGTNGLGQQVYIGLSDGDFGVGIVAGIGMAIIAICADRMTQALSRRVKGAHTETTAL